MEAGKDYILIVKYNASSSYYLIGVANAVNDDYIDAIIGAYNTLTTPVVGSVVPTTNDFNYKHYYKYEVN